MKRQRLVFYSGGQDPSNRFIHQDLVQLLGPKKSKSLTYIPYCSEGASPFFQRAVRRYAQFGVTDFRFLPADQKLIRSEMNWALKSDIIYLAGGNTFYFLKHLRRQGLLEGIRNHVKKGKVLAGLSAGGLIMTPNILLAGYPPDDADPNEVGLKNLNALNLVNFEFFPHYRNSAKMEAALLAYSCVSKYPIYACHDGGGIIVHGQKKSFFGLVRIFVKGQMVKID